MRNVAIKTVLDMDLIKVVNDAFANENVANYPKFKAGDTITVTYRIKEGDKERLQKFRGVVIQLRGASPATKTFTIRKISNGVGVERIFPFSSPFIDSIEMNKVGKVRRARIFYLRQLSGKKARIKEKKMNLVTCSGLNYGPLAQLNRAFDYGSKGYRFESCRGHKERA